MTDNIRVFELPDLGEGLVEARIAKFLIAVGDRVKRFDTVAEVDTDKATVEINVPWSGVVHRLVATEGDYVEVGMPVIEVLIDAAPEAA